MLEKLGTTAADLGELVAKAQDVLKGENNTAAAEHAEFKSALNSVLDCCAAHSQSLIEAGRTHKAMVEALNAFGPESDKYFNARIARNAELIGEQPQPAEQHQEAA